MRSPIEIDFLDIDNSMLSSQQILIKIIEYCHNENVILLRQRSPMPYALWRHPTSSMLLPLKFYKHLENILDAPPAKPSSAACNHRPAPDSPRPERIIEEVD